MRKDFEQLIMLWKNYNTASTLLTNAMGGTANEVGEFAERLSCAYYQGEQLPASNKSADILAKDGKLIQVKSRKISHLTTTSLNVIRSWDFDMLTIILFSKDGNILKAIEIDSETASSLSKRSDHQNGSILTTSSRLLDHPKAKDITLALQAILNGERSELMFPQNQVPKSKAEVIPVVDKNILDVSRPLSAPVIELVPNDVTQFKNELMRTKRAIRTFYYQDKPEIRDIWSANNFSKESNLMANIKTNNQFRNWKKTGLVKVRLEIID